MAAAGVAREAGFERAIGFDMGGTSTDVSLIVGGELERVFETEVGGIRVKSPMLRIHTVAAGGGSLCRFDGFRLTVGPEDVLSIADALRHLAGRVGSPDEPSVGLVAISYAAGPAILAALEENTRDKVSFILAIGGYYDIEAVVTFFTTGNFRDNPWSPWRHKTPNAYGKWVFVRANVPRIEDARDRVLLSAMAERKLRDLGAETPVADVAAWIADPDAPLPSGHERTAEQLFAAE